MQGAGSSGIGGVHHETAKNSLSLNLAFSESMFKMLLNQVLRLASSLEPNFRCGVAIQSDPLEQRGYWGGSMLEALVLAAGLGFLLGLRYRVPAVVPASAAAAVMGPVVAYLAGAEWWLVLIASVGAVVALQCGYLAGLLLTFLTAPRAKPDHDHDLGSPERYWADAKD